jgi:hypothetical protein
MPIFFYDTMLHEIPKTEQLLRPNITTPKTEKHIQNEIVNTIMYTLLLFFFSLFADFFFARHPIIEHSKDSIEHCIRIDKLFRHITRIITNDNLNVSPFLEYIFYRDNYCYFPYILYSTRTFSDLFFFSFSEFSIQE